MKIIDFGNERIKRLNVWDIGLVKGASILVGIIGGAFCSKAVKKFWPLLAVFAAGMSIPVLLKIFKDN